MPGWVILRGTHQGKIFPFHFGRSCYHFPNVFKNSSLYLSLSTWLWQYATNVEVMLNLRMTNFLLYIKVQAKQSKSSPTGKKQLFNKQDSSEPRFVEQLKQVFEIKSKHCQMYAFSSHSCLQNLLTKWSVPLRIFSFSVQWESVFWTILRKLVSLVSSILCCQETIILL